jgi:mono/diheme cytochrome c family protein
VIKEIILNGLENSLAEPGAPKMPAFRESLNEADAAAILAYLKSWWTDDQRSWQATVTQQSCTTPRPSP